MYNFIEGNAFCKYFTKEKLYVNKSYLYIIIHKKILCNLNNNSSANETQQFK